jgi:hypothetical protein
MLNPEGVDLDLKKDTAKIVFTEENGDEVFALTFTRKDALRLATMIQEECNDKIVEKRLYGKEI